MPFVFGLLGMCGQARGQATEAGWGIDACLTRHVTADNVAAGLDLLRSSGVRWVRERDVWIDDPALAASGADETVNRLRALKAAGFQVVAFAGGPLRADRPDNQLPEDLLAVYAAAFRQGRDCAELVDAWEMTGEPDVGYCRDLPDRLAAYNKAVYLGLHDGAASVGRSTLVLMGALALPPGPWLERAARNGLLNYTDAYNFHYYGHDQDLASVIRAHRQALAHVKRASLSLELKMKPIGRPADRSGYRPAFFSWETGLGQGGRGGGGRGVRASSGNTGPARFLPFWITECGVNAVVPGDFLNAERRAFQAEFTAVTARQARAARDVAMFMPFILVHPADPHAMVDAGTMTPLPAWKTYAELTREQPWPKRWLATESKRASPVVLQWMPVAGTSSHKVAGTYRVRAGEAITGEFRIYNFSDHEVCGEFTTEPTHRLRSEFKMKEIRIEDLGNPARYLNLSTSSCEATRVALRLPVGGFVTVPVSYVPKVATGYFREWTTARFRDDSQRVSQVVFGLERSPDEQDLAVAPVELKRLVGPGRLQPHLVNVEGPSFGPWRVFNGLAASNQLLATSNQDLTTSGWELAASNQKLATSVRFSVAKPVNDPLAPTYAKAALEGIPTGAKFLRVRLDRPMSRDAHLRVDLVDKDGQRFTIWENMGAVYGEASRDLWLGLADFHPYFWSKAVPGDRRLRPDAVREIQLRLYLTKGGALDVELEWAR